MTLRIIITKDYNPKDHKRNEWIRDMIKFKDARVKVAELMS